MDRKLEGRADELMDLQGRLARRFLFPGRITNKDDLPLARQELRVLLALGEPAGCRMGALATLLVVSVSSLTAIVERMVSKGLVERRPSARDRRVVLVALTAQGQHQFEQRHQARLHMAEGMLGALNPAEQRRFLMLMRKIVSYTTVLPLAALLLLASGCATARRAREVQNPASMRLGERTPAAAELGLATNSVLALDEAIRLALTNSPALVQARANVAIAESQLVQARADWLPQLDASASYTRAKKSGPATDGYGFGFKLSDDLFSFGRTTAAVRQARAQRDAVRAQYRAAEIAVVYAVRTAFYALYRAQELLAVDEDSVRQFQSHLDQVRIMSEVGTRIRYDVTTAEVALGNARFTALSARHTLLATRAALARQLGLVEDLPGAIVAPPPGVLPMEGRGALLARARASNPDLAALAAEVAAANAGIDAAIADLRPDLSFDAGYNWGGSSFPLTRSWSLGPALVWNLVSGWRKTSAVDIAAERLRTARAQVADRERQLFQDLVTALAQLDTARDQGSLTKLLVQQARENLDLVTERYRLGLATSVELTDAEVALSQTRSQQVQSQYDALIAIALIRLNTGD